VKRKKKDPIELCDEMIRECEGMKKSLDKLLILMKEENPSMR